MKSLIERYSPEAKSLVAAILILLILLVLIALTVWEKGVVTTDTDVVTSTVTGQ